jgi:hypothetical protein
MILITKNTTNTIFVTPQENSVTNYSFFWFKFTNRITQSVVSFSSDNVSTDARYQKFLFEGDAFENEDEGLWTYTIQGMRTSDDYNPPTSILETGLAYLKTDTPYTPTSYNQQNNTFITYNG